MNIKTGQTWVTIQEPTQYVEVVVVDTPNSASYKDGNELSVGYIFRGKRYYRSVDTFTKRYTLSTED